MIYLDSMGHLYSDQSIQELYRFAIGRLKLKPEWNHYGRLFPHFDLTTKKMKRKAIRLGAIEVSARNDCEQYERCRTMMKEVIKVCREKNIQAAYHCKGLLGQSILRLNFDKIWPALCVQVEAKK